MPLLLLLTLIPFVELLVLLRVHDWFVVQFGAQQALLLSIGSVIGTGVAGSILCRRCGLAVLRDIHQATARGVLPGKYLLEGLMVLIGGVLLLTPGYLTDLFGFTLILPLTRVFYRNLVVNWFEAKVSRGEVMFSTFANGGGFAGFHQQRPPSRHDDVIDVTPVEDRSNDSG